MSNQFLDKSGLKQFWIRIAARLAGKVDKVAGKDLSSNDYTNEDKSKVQTMKAAAAKNVDSFIVSASTSENLPTSKAVASFVENKGYKTTDNNTTYTIIQNESNGRMLTLRGSDGTSQTVTIPDSIPIVDLSTLGIENVKNIDQSKAIKTIRRDGTTFIYTCLDGTTGTFTQQDNNTWIAMVGATSDSNGRAGYVPAPPSSGYNTKYLRADGAWTIPPDTNTKYTLTQDTSDRHKFIFAGTDGTNVSFIIPDNNTVCSLETLGIGNVKNYDQSKAIKSIRRDGTTFTATCLDNTSFTFDQQDSNTWRNVSDAVDSTASDVAASSKAVKTVYDLAVSKTSNTGTVTKVSTGAGLTGGDITTTGTVKANLRSETKLTNASAAATETAGRVYPVALDKDGKLCVNVPWVDTNTQTITGVKGNAESSYRTGNVNITAANIGLGNVNNTADANKFVKGLKDARDSSISTTTDLTFDDPIEEPDGGGAVQYPNPRSLSNYPCVCLSKRDGTGIGAFDFYEAVATTSAAGFMSAADKTKLNGIAAGAQVNSITGVKGNAESSYRTGNVNITAANVCATISVTSSDPTVANIYNAIKNIGNGNTAGAYFSDAGMNLISGGKLALQSHGTITQVSASGFRFIGGYIANQSCSLVACRFDITSSAITPHSTYTLPMTKL